MNTWRGRNLVFFQEHYLLVILQPDFINIHMGEGTNYLFFFKKKQNRCVSLIQNNNRTTLEVKYEH